MEIKQLNMQEMNLDSIDTAHYNPRKDLRPGDKAYERLKNSILTYGYIDPMIFNERTGRLVGGHQRLKILRDLGMEKAQVSVVDLDEMQEKDLNIRLNKIQGEFENEALANVLRELEQESFDLENIGFDQSEFDELITEIHLDNKRNASFLDDMISEQEQVNNERRLYDAYTPSEEGYTSEENVNVNHNVNENEEVEHYKNDPTYEEEESDTSETTEYFHLGFPVDYEQRDLINKAIRQAKQDYDVATSTEALLQICIRYLNKQ